MDKGVESLGDGLFRIHESGEIFCLKKLLGTKVEQCKVTYDYGTYEIAVSWVEDEDGKRTDPHWVRTYKEVGT